MSAVGSIQDVLQDKRRQHNQKRETQKQNPELKRDSWISSSWVIPILNGSSLIAPHSPSPLSYGVSDPYLRTGKSRTKKETPAPGAYDIRDFLQERQLNPVQPTFSFKCQGRTTKPNSAASGELLLPGCYNFPDFAYFAEKRPNTYSFKNTRRNTLLLGIRDKDLHTDPSRYNVAPLPSEPRQCKDFMFRSAVKRFPSRFLVPREGPGPGDYEVKSRPSCSISSCFRSKVPRFPAYYSKTPGPGMYEPIRQFPKQTPSVAEMGRQHGIFFSSSFDLEIVNRRKQ